MKYIADFKVYYKDSLLEIVDVKGRPISQDFSMQRKLLEKAIGQEVAVMEYSHGEWRENAEIVL
ncbi:DUF1064 domain-containing protein [Domibacillus mangrovi]|uniref:DUF1064 domain-containing protein n=1 Tax=Domibacillus mangrovi TaxID=1714354 RepID=UPI000ABC253F|nr:DUF1064 domain-containing protein [Domibacillus mangrovi]